MPTERLLEKPLHEVDRLLDKLDDLARRARPHVPFTILNAVWRTLDKGAKSIVDVGCGLGEPMRFINRQGQFHTVGVDIFEPYLRKNKRQGIHSDYVLADVRQLPFPGKVFDVVLSMEVLEHLEREEGLAFLKALEGMARTQVIITTPVGTYKQDAYDGNPYQEHRFAWNPADMEGLGYKVRRLGFLNMGGDGALVDRLPRVLRPLGLVLWVAAGPLVQFAPKLAGHMIAIKKLGTDGYSEQRSAKESG